MLENEIQEKLVTDNLKLVHYILKGYFGYNPSNSEYEDFVSVGTIGLIKASKNFDESKSKFTTYAVAVIKNEILMYLKKKKKDKNTISINTPLSTDDTLTLEDAIEDPDSNFIDTLIDTSQFENILTIILNSNSIKAKIATLYFLSGKTQLQVGKILNVSQSYASRLRQRMVEEIKKHLKHASLSSNIFSINILDNSYKISFLPVLVPNYSQAFSFILNEMAKQCSSSIAESSETYDFPNFNVSYKEERISIVVPRCAESFVFLAELFKQMYNKRLS